MFSFMPLLVNGQTKTEPIRILIVPGHDEKVWGAQYGNLKEADMNLVLATQIYNTLKKDKRFVVYITRDNKGYKKEFADYFSSQKDNIISFKENAKKNMNTKISNGSFTQVKSTPHNAVSADTSVVLYGINKWANENNMDAVVHVHFNDVVRKTVWKQADAKGFAVYVPQEQMPNAVGSISLGKSIFDELLKKYIPSNFYLENGGFVKEQKLIALGASGTLNKDIDSVLIEYGYIYRFGNTAFRHAFYKKVADLTAKGIVKKFTSP